MKMGTYIRTAGIMGFGGYRNRNGTWGKMAAKKICYCKRKMETKKLIFALG